MRTDINKPYILTIDDDQDFNILLNFLFKDTDLQIKITTSHTDFLNEIKEHIPDLCIIDLNLDIAYGAGFQLIQAIRNTIKKKIPIIVISRRSNQQDIDKAFELGADDFIEKPLDDIILKAKLEKFLNIQNLIKELPRYNLSTKDQACIFNIDCKLIEVFEEQLVISCTNMMNKSQLFHISATIINKIFNLDRGSSILFSVLDFTKEQDFYLYKIELVNPTSEMQRACRKWILNRLA